MHGKNINPSEKWYPWFKEEMEKKGIQVQVPILPKSDEPVLDEWLNILGELNPDEKTVLLGHSRGGVAVLRFLESMPAGKKVKKVILLATNSGSAKFMAIPGEDNHGFYTKDGYDFAKIKSHCDEFVAFHSRDDKWVPFAHGEENAQGLNAKFITFDNKGHFGKNDSIVPGLIEEVLS
jgi:predicted alpha/beta hydrolase family esterase